MSFEGSAQRYDDTPGIRSVSLFHSSRSRAERDSALKTIAEFGRVTTSYRASEAGVVTTCIDDVRKCNLYIGILGQRYGYVPPAAEGNSEEKSITELEYEACRTPGQPPIPRLMFIKPTKAGIADEHIDAISNTATAARMKAFLNRAGKDQTAYVFKNLDDLRSELRIRVKDQADQFHEENHGNVLHRPCVQDFTGYLAAKRKGFVGREWLFERIIDWTVRGTSRSMLITGDPGLGKSAIVAEMVERREKMGVIAWFCCRWEQPDQLAPRVFVEAIAASLVHNLPAYAQALEAPELQTLLEKAQTSREVGPRTLFEQLVLSPLAKLPDQPTESRLILIDVLDESLVVPEGIVDLLAATLDQWPQWLRMVATTRNYPEVRRSLHGMQAEELNVCV
jgi:Domain of unknown function (DUF4062)/AAA ATPase domain